MSLPTGIYTAEQVRALDRHAIEACGIPGYTLMKRAGEAALRYLRSRWPARYKIVIVCGAGNNGGDGYVLGRFAQAAGSRVVQIGNKENLATSTSWCGRAVAFGAWEGRQRG